MISTERSSRVRTIASAAVLAAAMAALPVAAKQSDRSKDVQVSARSADASAQPNGVSHLKGDVKIVQGTLQAHSTDATVHFDAQSQVKRVVLTGSAHIQQEDDNGNLMQGDAQSIDYNVPQGIATLTGNAHVVQPGRGSASGDTLVYNTQTSRMTAQSSGDNRVHLTFKPRQEAPAGATATTPAAPAPAASAAAPAPARSAGN